MTQVGRLPRRGAFSWTMIEILFLVLNLVFIVGGVQKWFLLRFPSDLGMVETGAGGLPASRLGHFNILFLGIDSVEGTHRTDTLVLVGVSPGERKISILSVPRDTRVVINGAGRKINEVLPRYGEYVLRTMLENLLEIRISRSVMVDFQGFVRIIDLIGGVDLEIEHPMHYDDNWGNVHIHFEKGPAHLDGKKALDYVRFRADAGADLNRIKRQQRFIAALLEKMRSPAMVMRLPQIIREGLSHFQTDLGLGEALDLAYSLSGGKLAVQSMSLPGEARYIDKISYYLPYKDQAVAIGAKEFSNLMLLDLEASFTPSIGSIPSVIATASAPVSTASVPVASVPVSIASPAAP
jgi:LCP family protein required for cell wall assembly